jgi:carbonic anhydrase
VHKATSCLISCIDFRIQESIFDWLKQTHNLGKTDVIEVAGSSRDLVKPLKEADKEELLRNINISVQLHAPENIFVMDHQDCGGYAQDNTILPGLSAEEDLQKHIIYLQKAKTLLQKEFPTKKIKTLYVTLSGEITEIS